MKSLNYTVKVVGHCADRTGRCCVLDRRRRLWKPWSDDKGLYALISLVNGWSLV